MLGIYQSATSGVVISQVSGTGQTPSLVSLYQLHLGALSPNYYIVKYDSTGKVVWGTVINTDATSNSISGEITIDSSNNIYITGRYKQNTNPLTLTDALLISPFQTQSLVTLPATLGCAFIIKYNSNGQTQWATFLNSISGLDDGTTLMIDSSNNLIVGGIVFTDLVSVYAQDVSGTSQVPAQYYINDNINQAQSGFLIKYS